jgi:uncharacterized membrane protein YphA (DoxX/SURF4 family)
MSQTHTVGLRPALPWVLGRSAWWNEPVPAERLAALRIGVAAVLLWDVLFTYLPLAGEFFGRDSLGSPEVFGGAHVWWRWSALRGVGDPGLLQGALGLWAVAAALLLVGVVPRLSAAFAWLMSVSVIGINYYLHNSGDNVRTIALFYLMLCPCGAVWALGHKPRVDGPVSVPPWALRLLLIQLACIYFFNGVYKLCGPDWREGNVLHTVLGNLAWTRLPYEQLPLSYPLTQFMTWTVLIWELTFPVLVMTPWLRKPALWMGVSFHLGTAALLQLGPFPFYMLCLYLPLVPWERYTAARRKLYSAEPGPTRPGLGGTGKRLTDVSSYGA